MVPGILTDVITTKQRSWRMAVRHRLTSAERTDDVAAITDDLVALHSSDPASVFLSALVRMETPSIEAIESALYDDRSLVRHHAMRRTIWVMTPHIAQLAHGSATAKIAAAEAKQTVKALEATTDIADAINWLADAKNEVAELLAVEGSMTTREIGQALPHLVFPVIFGVNTKNPGSLNAHTKVLQGAGFDGLLMRGRPRGWISAEYPWMATTDWLGHEIAGLGEVEAAGPLLDRWLQRFGPGTLADIRWWFGWTATLANKALAACNAEEVALENGTTGYVAEGDTDPVEAPGPWVRLLPGLDPTTMGWKERDWYIDPDDVPLLFDRWGNAGPTIWADGQVVGGWVQRPDGQIAAHLSKPLGAEHTTLLDEAIEQLSAAVGGTVVRPRFPAPIQKQLLGD